MMTKASADGHLVFLRSGIDSPDRGDENSQCICCDGRHIFGSRVVLEGITDYRGRPVTHPGEWIEQFTTQKKDGKPVFEGKRVRITVEIIE